MTNASLFSMIPVAVLARVRGSRVIEVGFGAGPGLCVRKSERFSSPVSLKAGLAWLEQHRAIMRRGQCLLEDGSVLRYDDDRFASYQLATVADRAA
jgi:hypothetical protein